MVVLVAFSANAARQDGSEALLLSKTASAVVCRLCRSLTLRHAPLFVWRHAVSPHPHSREVAATYTTALIA